MEVRYPPLKRSISAILARYPMKTRQMGAIPPSAILSRKGIARYGGVSRTGLREDGSICPFDHLLEVSDTFYFFLLGEGEGGIRGAGKGGESVFFHLKIPGGGGKAGRGRGAGRVPAANWGILGGRGGAKYFFRGRHVHQDQFYSFLRAR